MTARYVGTSLTRREDARFLTGQARFVNDVMLPGMVHAALARSPHAHAKLLAVDATKARALPGVLAVLTWQDIAARAAPIPIRLGPLPGFERYRQYPLASEHVRYVGEPVALVVAESRHVAEDALDLLDIDFDPLPPVADLATAAADASLVHPAAGTNRASSYQVALGAPEDAFRGAEYVRRETFRCHRHGGVPLETRGLVADWDAAAGRLTIHGASKIAYWNRRALAAMLALPEDAIAMVEVDVGGGFGVRGEFYPEDFLVPFAAMQIGRPVKWIEDRREHLTAANHSRDVTCELEIAARRDGTFLGLRARVIADMGAYVRTNGGVVPSKTAQFLPGPYRFGNVAIEVVAMITNKTPMGTLRGPGRYEASFFRERLIDLMAADLGLDPAEVRMKNLVRPQDMPYSIGRLVPHEEPTEYDNGDYPAALARLLAEIDYPRLLARCGTLRDGWLEGVGLGCFVEATGAGNQEAARILVREAGRVEIHVGASSMGQGHETTLAQVAADILRLPPAAIDVVHGSTGVLDWGYGTFASRTMVMAGNAVRLAAETLSARIVAWAARQSGLEPSMLAFEDGAVRVRRATDAAPGDGVVATLGTLLQAAGAGDEAAAAALDAAATYTQPKRTYTYGACAAHVAVDPATAQVKLLRYLTVEDIGRAVNPMIVHGQAVGAAVQGIGATFLDEFRYDEHGQLLTGTLADYLLASATDFPNVDTITTENAPSTLNPLGVKGAGEGGIIATGGALANAVAHALAPLGVQITALPLSMDNLATALRAARARRTSS